MFRIITLSALAATCLLACNKSKYDGYRVSDSGLHYKFFKQNEKGKKARIGDVLVMDMVYATEKDSILFDTRKQGQAVMVPLELPTYKGGIEEGFAMLAEGDSASFIVGADSLFMKTFGQAKLPPFVDPGTGIKFYLKLNSVRTKEDITKEREKLDAERAVKMETLKKEESAKLEAYIKAKGIKASPRPSGLIYIETKAGNGPMAKDSSNVKVNYVGRLIDGTLFDTNNEKIAKAENRFQEGRPYEPFAFKLGATPLIPGWTEGMKMMKEGGKATLIIPSSIGYGQADQGIIPPYSTLIFEVEMLEVK
jgi:FKBP-type peptidyl-prolyl cis-trans isomerase